MRQSLAFGQRQASPLHTRPIYATRRAAKALRGDASPANKEPLSQPQPQQKNGAPKLSIPPGTPPEATPATSHKADGSSKAQKAKAAKVEAEMGPLIMSSKPLPKVLIVHTGGTLGMDAEKSFEACGGPTEVELKAGTGGHYGGLRPGEHLDRLLNLVPELRTFANLKLQVAYNKDSSRVGPREWQLLARLLDAQRRRYDAFLVVHGTDTMAYTASALSLMLLGFRKPIILTGSQLPLLNPRTDARTNLIDAIACATAYFHAPHVQLQEVVVCFGGRLLRGNRAQKVDSSVYQAFDSPGFPHLATLGVQTRWNMQQLLKVEGVYRPRFKLDPHVLRVPIVPGSDPRQAYGDLVQRGVKGIVLEAFGTGNMPDIPAQGWLPWLRQQRKKGLLVYLTSQCLTGPLHPELYRAGAAALSIGVESGPHTRMTAECATVKVMQCLCYPDMPLGVPLAGEM